MSTLSKRWIVVWVIGQGVLLSLALTGFVRIGFWLNGKTLSSSAADRLFVISSIITGAMCATLFGVMHKRERAKSIATSPHRSIPSSDGDAIIRVARTKSYADRCRSYRISVDGRIMARLKAGQSAEIRVPPGAHSVVAKIDWCSSPTLNLRLRKGETAELECTSSLRGLRVFLALLYIVFLRKRYLSLNRV